MALKLGKFGNRLFLQNPFAFTLTNLVKYVRVYENESILNVTFSASIKATDSFIKNRRYDAV